LKRGKVEKDHNEKGVDENAPRKEEEEKVVETFSTKDLSCLEV